MGKKTIGQIFNDNRKNQIIYISSCILNQNQRFPGIAICDGAVTELIEPLIKNGLGIEQLPCLECMGWGGISRKNFFKFLPMILKYTDSWLNQIIKFFVKIWIFKFKKLCKKTAFKVVNQMSDYLRSDYSIRGIIAMNDSPTCGFTKTIDLLKSAHTYKILGLKIEDFENLEFEKMKIIIPKLCEEGTGLFMAEILNELEKRRININVFEFNPWNNIKSEVERIINRLKLYI